MSKTNHTTPQTYKYAFWVYTHPKKQNIICLNDYDDDVIFSRYQKQRTFNDKPYYFKNLHKLYNILKSFVNKKFVDFEQCVKNSGFYDQCKKYVNFKSWKINVYWFYVNTHGFICEKPRFTTLAPKSAIIAGDGAIFISAHNKMSLYRKHVHIDKYMEQNTIYFNISYYDGETRIKSIKAYCLIDYNIYTFPDINNIVRKHYKHKERNLKYSDIDDLLLAYNSLDFDKFIKYCQDNFKKYCQDNFKKLHKIQTHNHPFKYWK